MISVKISPQTPLSVKILPQTPLGVNVGGEFYKVGDYEHYKGDYSVTPKFENQTLTTKNKAMDFDVDVKSIPIEKVSNPSGGNTIIIGG